MPEVSDESARLVVVSPPFADGPGEPPLDKARYAQFITVVLQEVARVVQPDGVLVVINTDLRDHSRYNRGRTEFDGTVWYKHAALRTLAESAGFRCFDCKIWAKSLGTNVYRFNYSFTQFFCRNGHRAHRPGRNVPHRPFRTDVWLLPGGTQRTDSTGHRFRNAVHPTIVERCISEFTDVDDLVVSPFTGSGTVLAMAHLMNRRWIGYEVDRRLSRLISESIYGPVRPKVYGALSARIMQQTQLSPRSAHS
jgi:modification methylase